MHLGSHRSCGGASATAMATAGQVQLLARPSGAVGLGSNRQMQKMPHEAKAEEDMYEVNLAN